MKRSFRIVASIFLAVFAVIAVIALASSAPARAAGGPGVSDGNGAVLTYGTTVLNNATTTLTSTAAKASSADSWIGYSNAEYFVTFVPLSLTTTAYFTPQVSSDSINWVNLTYTYLNDGTITTSSVVTGTDVMTSTSTGSATLTTGNYAQNVTGSGTLLFRLPSVGVYTRLLMQLSKADTTTVTVTLIKKNGGN